MKVEDIGLDVEFFHTGTVTYVSRSNVKLQESSVKHYASILEGPDNFHLMSLDEDDEDSGVYLYFHEDELELLKATINFIKLYRGPHG